MSRSASQRRAAPPPLAEERRDRALEEAKRSFLRMVSHELRTPLNAIIGFSEILSCELYGPLGAPQYKEYAEIVRASGHRLLRLVNQVLEIAKLEGGGAEIDLRAEPVDAVLEEAVAAAAEDAAARGVRFDVAPAPAGLAALADAKALRTVLANLVQNAATFAPEGSVVRLSAEARGPLVVLAVENDGEGLDPEELPRLMRPFEQGENALVRRAEGAGLGWPIVLLLSRAMGGSFEVRTAPGEGLTASIVLRRASA